MEDCCIVCAEPLEWVAYGHCGHKDACSKCVTRLRFVLEDHRCVICQQKLPAVFVTRFLGEYTKALPAREFEELQVRSFVQSLLFIEESPGPEGIQAKLREAATFASATCTLATRPSLAS